MELSDYSKLHVGAKVHNKVHGHGVVTKVLPLPKYSSHAAYEANFSGDVRTGSLICTTSIESAVFQPKPGDLVMWGGGVKDYVFVGELPGDRVALVEEAGKGEEWMTSRAIIRPREGFCDLRPAKKPPIKLKVKVEIERGPNGRYYVYATSDRESGFDEKLDGAVASRIIEFEIAQ